MRSPQASVVSRLKIGQHSTGKLCQLGSFEILAHAGRVDLELGCKGITLDAGGGVIVTRLAGKVALVTGGGTGMGRAIALAFAREGAKVAVAARRMEKLQEVVREIKESGGEGLAVQCDVTRGADAQRAVRQASERFGQLNILVNNAGVLSVSTVEGIAEEEWDRLMAANLKGPYLMS